MTLQLPIAFAEPETARRYAPNHLRAECPICGRTHRFCAVGRKSCNGENFIVITPAAFAAVLRYHMEKQS